MNLPANKKTSADVKPQRSRILSEHRTELAELGRTDDVSGPGIDRGFYSPIKLSLGGSHNPDSFVKYQKRRVLQSGNFMSKIEIIPLGGIGEFGMNCMGIRYDGEMIVVDAGMGFP